jgi:peptidoglycan/LPS O-acetylase OafA/YrhL
MPREASFYSAHHVPAALSFILASLVKGGAYGVDIFFVLSAYLITGLLSHEKSFTGSVHVGKFYMRRICRIWPLYFLVLAISLLVTVFDSQQNLTWRQAAIFALFSGNWIFVFNPDPIYSIANPLWSVSVEEQFYLAWPWVVKRLSIRKAIAIMLLVSWTTRFVLVLTGAPFGVWNNTLAHLDPIALGALLSIWLNGRLPILRTPTRAMLIAVGILAIGIGGALPISEFPASPWVLLLYPLISIGGSLIVFASLNWGSWMLNNKAVVYLGGISYGIYVFHRPCLWFLKRVYFGAHKDSLSNVMLYWFCGLALTLCVAALSKRFFESPFIRMKEHFTTAESPVQEQLVKVG